MSRAVHAGARGQHDSSGFFRGLPPTPTTETTMPRIVTRATLTLNPLKLVIEQETHPSSLFPAAEVVETTGSSMPSDHPPRPLAKAVPRDRARNVG